MDLEVISNYFIYNESIIIIYYVKSTVCLLSFFQVNNSNLNKVRILSHNLNLEESISNLLGLRRLAGLKLLFELLPGQYKPLLVPHPGPHQGPHPDLLPDPLPGLKLLCLLQDPLNQGLLFVQMFNLYQLKIDPNQFQLSVVQVIK